MVYGVSMGRREQEKRVSNNGASNFLPQLRLNGYLYTPVGACSGYHTLMVRGRHRMDASETQ